MKKGLIVSPYSLRGVFEVDLRDVKSKEPLLYAFGELMARFDSGPIFDEKDGIYAEIYRGYNEYIVDKPKTKILKHERKGYELEEGTYVAFRKVYSPWCQCLDKHYFFITSLLEEVIDTNKKVECKDEEKPTPIADVYDKDRKPILVHKSLVYNIIIAIFIIVILGYLILLYVS